MLMIPEHFDFFGSTVGKFLIFVPAINLLCCIPASNFDSWFDFYSNYSQSCVWNWNFESQNVTGPKIWLKFTTNNSENTDVDCSFDFFKSIPFCTFQVRNLYGGLNRGRRETSMSSPTQRWITTNQNWIKNTMLYSKSMIQKNSLSTFSSIF